MKRTSWITYSFFFSLGILGAFSSNINAATPLQPVGFHAPTQLPQTQYHIEAAVNPATNRLEGSEEIRILNSSSLPLKRLFIDWPYQSSEKLQIRIENLPVLVIAEGKNGLSPSQILIELPKALKNGESITLQIPFGFSLRLGNITNLQSWYPRLGWERDTADDYEVKINAPETYQIAASGVWDTAKNYYIAKGCRTFGLVFMKGLKVLKDKSGDTEIYSYYDEGTQKCVEFTHRTAIEVIDFYRKWLDFYPHKILHIVPGGLSHPAGGYPIAKSIVGIHGQARMEKAPKSHWQFITAHEIGHQYWMEQVLEAPNTFWLMIGLGVYADRAFMLAKGYGDQHERDMIGRYIQGVRDQVDTRMNRLPEEMEEVSFDYNNIVNHGKGFGVISALACMLGKDTFESAYKRCLKEFKNRTLDAVEFQRVCEAESGETLDWFFDQWIRSSRFLSYKIMSNETAFKNGVYTTTAIVRNLGTLKMPVPVTAIYEDGSRQSLYTDRFLDECTLVFTGKTPVKEVKLDAENELPLVIPPPDATAGQLKQEISKLNVLGEGDKALEIFNQAKNIPASESGLNWGKLGLCLYDGKHYEAALQAFRTDFKENPTSFSSLVWLGHILDLTNRRQEAIHYYKQALELKPTSRVRHDQYGIQIDLDWIQARLKTPFERKDSAAVNQVSPQENPSEPTLAEILKKMGCDESVVAHPRSVNRFKAVTKPSINILQKNGNAKVTLGWYQKDQEHPLFEPITGPTSPTTFDPGQEEFGFYLHVVFQDEYQWYTEAARNNGEAHVKVYPLLKQGEESSNTYLLCWEDLPLSTEENDDFQDIIVCVSGVSPTASQSFSSQTGDFPKFSFHLWGSTPFASNITNRSINQHLLFCIRKDPKTIAEIAKEIKSPIEQVSQVLTELNKYAIMNNPILAEPFRLNSSR